MPLERDPQKPEQEIQTGNEGEASEDETRTRPPVARTVVEVPDSILQTYRTYQKQQDRENKISRWIAIAAVAGAWIYAGITAFQLCATREANTIARNAVKQTQDIMQAADRPWVGIVTVGMMEFQVGKKMKIQISLQNSGKTPALRMRPSIGQAYDRSIPDNPPAIKIDVPYQGEIVMTPNQNANISIVRETELSMREFNEIMNGQQVVVVWGTIIYTDQFHIEGETTLCMIYSPIGGNFYGCTHGNDAK